MIKLLIGTSTILGLVLVAGLATGRGDRLLAATTDDGLGQAIVADYVTAAVTVGNVRRTISATGSLQAVSTVEVSSQLSGQIARLYVDFNDPVEAGQPLAELDQRGFRARVAEAAAAAQMARENVTIRTAQLERADDMALEAEARRTVFGARADQARVALDAAERRMARIEQLASRGTAAKSELEDAVSERDTAAAALREAEGVVAAHEHVVASSRAARDEADAELANARAGVPLRDAALAIVQYDLERSTIRAPIDGVVVGRNLEMGQTVAASLDAPVLFMIAGDLAKMEIHANIDETDIGEIAIGQAAEFAVDAYPGRSFTARVSEIRKAARLVQGVVIYTVVLDVSNADHALLPGMTSTVRVIVDEAGPVATVPLSALRFTPDDDTPAESGALGDRVIWVLDGGAKPRPRAIRVGIDDGSAIAVLGGELREDDRVVTGRRPAEATGGVFGIRF